MAKKRDFIWSKFEMTFRYDMIPPHGRKFYRKYPPPLGNFGQMTQNLA